MGSGMYVCMYVLYLPMYNVYPCVIHTPTFDCTLEKKKEAENRGSGYEKMASKHHDLETLKMTT